MLVALMHNCVIIHFMYSIYLKAFFCNEKRMKRNNKTKERNVTKTLLQFLCFTFAICHIYLFCSNSAERCDSWNVILFQFYYTANFLFPIVNNNNEKIQKETKARGKTKGEKNKQEVAVKMAAANVTYISLVKTLFFYFPSPFSS